MKQVGMLLLALSFSSCEKPQLKTDTPVEEPDGLVEKPAGEMSFEEIRKSVIGQTFETLTLGTKVFAQAQVRNITERVIVVAHADGVDEVLWSEVSDEVRKKWGYDPSVPLTSPKVASAPSVKKEMETVEVAKAEPVPEPELDPQERAKKIDLMQKMLDAQLAGIRTMESDLARQSQPLNALRQQLQSIKARQSGRSSNKLVVEMVGGTSKRVDRKKEAAELEQKIKVEEQLVAQLSQSLQTARKTYDSLKAELNQLQQR